MGTRQLELTAYPRYWSLVREQSLVEKEPELVYSSATALRAAVTCGVSARHREASLSAGQAASALPNIITAEGGALVSPTGAIVDPEGRETLDGDGRVIRDPLFCELNGLTEGGSEH